MSEMETVKKYIISVLTSTPLTMTMSQLNKDYRNMLGEEIPYAKLGYNSLEHFLKSVPDTVHVKGNGFMATVLPVVSEKSKHINDLVTNQKVIKKKTPNRPTFHIQQRKHLQYQKPAYTNPTNQPQRQKIFYPPSDSGSSCQKIPENPVQNTSIQQNNQQIDSKLNLGTNRVPEKSPNGYPKILDSHKPKNSSYVDEKSNILNSSGCGRTKKPPCLLNKMPDDQYGNIESKIPLTVRKNLKQLIGKYEDGIWCADVPRLYRQMFHCDINYEELGYVSLSQLCISLPSIFHYSRPAHGDFKLYDKSKPLPASADKTFTVASYTIGKRRSLEENVSAVPNIDWDDVSNFLPDGVFKPGSEIPREFVPPDTKEGDTIKIVVGEVYDLSKFWVYLDNRCLDDLMDDMQDFYRLNASAYLMPANLIREGIYCVQMFYNEYHRAFIVDVLPELEDTIRVLFIDYGTMTKVPTKGICFLHERFADLPAQAIRCRLADICPTEECVPWSREASSTFRAMVKSDRTIDAKLTRINWKEQILEAYLIDVTSPSKQFCLNTKLVERGLAQYPDQGLRKSNVDSAFKPLVKYLHLFPTFLELEHGYAPSTQEMDVLMNCDVPTSLCYPQYFSIDRTHEQQTILEVEEFYSKKLQRKRTCKSSYLDMSCVVTKKFDLAYFGDLAPEIAEFMAQNDAYIEYTEEEPSEEITRLFQQLEEIKKETAEKIQQDRELAEDIMRELEILKYEGGASCSDENRENEVESTMQSDRLMGSGEGGNERKDFDKPSPKSTDTSDLIDLQDNYSSLDVECSSSSKNTNPFLSDCYEEPEVTNEPLVLNPNNPFLSYLLGDQKDQSSSPTSDHSSTSTVYETYIEEVKVEQKWVNNENKEVKIEQRWSNDNDVVSLVESLSIKNAPDTAQVSTSQKNRDCAIQTGPEAPIEQPTIHQVPQPGAMPNLPYGGYQPPQQFGGYTPWSTAADCAPFGFHRFGPRYPTPGYGFSDFGPPMQPWMMQMLWRMQMRSQYNSGMGPAYQQQSQYYQHPQYQQQFPYQHQFQPRGPIRPPPGFYPPLPAPSQGPSKVTSNSRSTASTSSQTTSSTVTSNSTDFYDAYNKQLKQMVDNK